MDSSTGRTCIHDNDLCEISGGTHGGDTLDVFVLRSAVEHFYTMVRLPEGGGGDRRKAVLSNGQGSGLSVSVS